MSATSKKGEQSGWKKLRERFFLCWVAACVCVMVFLAGCSQAGTTSNGGASKASESVSSSVSASSALSESASDASSDAVDESDFVGSWEIVQVTKMDASSGENSEEVGISPESIKSAREKGVDYFVVLNPDGTAVYVLGGVYFYGTWGIEDDFADRGLGTAALTTFSSSTSDGGSKSYIAFIEESKLMLMDGRYLVECEKAEDKKPLSKDEHDTALEAFVGTWHLISLTRDGVTITKEDGQITSDTMYEFKDDMTVTQINGEDTLDAPWFITGAYSGYIYNPVEGDKIVISDGVLTEDFGEKGTASFVKE